MTIALSEWQWCLFLTFVQCCCLLSVGGKIFYPLEEMSICDEDEGFSLPCFQVHDAVSNTEVRCRPKSKTHPLDAECCHTIVLQVFLDVLSSEPFIICFQVCPLNEDPSLQRSFPTIWSVSSLLLQDFQISQIVIKQVYRLSLKK